MEDYRTGSVRSRSRSRSPPPRDYGAPDDRAYLDTGGHTNGLNNNYDEGAVHLSSAGVVDQQQQPPPQNPAPGGSEPVALYVGNLDYATTEEGLHSEFGIFGPVVSVSIPIDRSNNRPKGYGFVTMGNRQDAEDAIVKLDQSEFQGRTIRVSESRPKSHGPPPRGGGFGDRVGFGGDRGGFGGERAGERSGFGGDRAGGRDSSGFGENSRGPPERDFGRPSSSSSSAAQVQFWVGNLSFRTTDRELINIFRPFGEVLDCSVPVHRENGKPRGYGFVTLRGLSSKDINQVCRELDGTELDGRGISVMEARQKDRGPPGGGGGGGRGGDRGGFGGSRDFGGGRDDGRSSRYDDRGSGRGGGGDRGGGGGGYDRGADYSGGNDRGRETYSKSREYNDAY